MKKLQKYFIVLFIMVFLLLSTVQITYAALEITYPNVPGLPSINTNNPTLGEYIGYIFGLLVYIGGFLALISFAIGAIGLLTSADNAEASSNAKDRMKGATLGLVLTVASFIIIKTINPTFVTPVLTPLQGMGGVFYSNGTNQKPCPQENPDVSNTATRPEGYNNIQYCCNADCSGGDGPNLLIWKFPGKNFEGSDSLYAGDTVERISCGMTTPVGNGSFRMAFETPGVYYCLGPCGGNICSGYMSGANTASQNAIAVPFTGSIQGVTIVNDTTDTTSGYGVIFHGTAGLENGGECDLPVINEGTGPQCMPISSAEYTVAVDIFKFNKDSNSSGNGVSFYSKPWGVDTGAHSGFYPGPDSIVSFYPSQIDSNDMEFDWTLVDVPDEYKSACSTFNKCPGSIKMKGDYLVALYDNNGNYCQTFSDDADNLNTEQIIGQESTSLGDVIVIPTK